MKRIISIITLTIMLITSLPVSVYISAAEALSFEGERAASEELYYSDIFYSYPRYLKDSPYLNEYQAKSSALISNVLAEYVTTEHFALSVTSQVLGQATDISSVVKYLKANMNYQDFVFENELDTANRLLLQAISENDIKKGASVYSKNASEQIKNFSTLTKLATSLEETTDSLEDAGYISDDIDMYEGLLTVTFDFLGEVAPRLSSKLPEINETLENQLGDNLEAVSDLADAMEFAAALAVTVMAQEAQLELVYQILNDAPADSMLYAGMYRLKGQLEGGAVTFFTETYLKDAVFKKVIDKFTDGIIKSIGGKVPGLNVVSLVLAVVDVVNTVVFKWILGADYDTYISAVLLTDYKEGLAATLDNMSDRYAVYFSSDDIIAYDNVFNTYITVNKEVYNLYCKLSEHNTNYNSAYTASMSGIYEDMTYEKYINEVKAYILSIPEEIRERADRGTWNISSDAVLAMASDDVSLGRYYIPYDFKGDITISKGHLIINPGDSYTVQGNLNITGSDAKFTNYGSVNVQGSLNMGTANCYLYNYGSFTAGSMTITGYYRNSSDYYNPFFYNYGEAAVYGDFTMTGTSKQMLFMTEGEPVLRIHGNIAGISNNYNVTCGMILLCGEIQQSVSSMSVNNLTVTNPEGIKYTGHMYVKGRYDLCGNTLDNNGYTTYLEGSGSLAPDNDYKKVYVNCALTLEGYVKGEYTLQQNMSITVPEGINAVIDGDLLITGAYSNVTNNGELTVTGLVNMSSRDPKLYNYGSFTAGSMTITGYYRNSSDYYNPFFYNYGEAVVYGDFTMKGTSKQMLFMTEGEPILRIYGNIAGISNNYNVTCGMILLCGETQQTVGSMSVNNLTVTNPEGIKYTGHIYVKGRYDLCGNALDNNGYTTYLEGSGSLAPDNDYKKVYVNCALTLEGYVKGEYTLQQNMSITVPEGVNAVIYGDLLITGANSKVTNNGELTVTGLVDMKSSSATLNNYGKFTAGNMTLTGYYRNSSDYYNPFFYNYGEATVNGDFSMTGTSKTMLFNSSDDAVLYIGGNYVGNGASGLTKGKLVLCGDSLQSIKNTGKLNTLVIENESYEGVKFESNIDYTTLFDHKGNRFTAGSLSNVDYDGDGMIDRYDPKPTVNEKASVITRDYDVIIGHADEISHIRYAGGIHESSSSIKNAEDRVDIDASVIAENTENNVYTRNMPDGGVYTFWIRLTDGTTMLRTVDMSYMKQRVSADGVRITIDNLYGIKDYFIAEGDFDSYSEIKENGYIFSATAAKLAGKHSYTHTVSNPGVHTVLVRYTDTSRLNEVFKVDLVVEEPTFTVNGLQVTIGNIPDVKVIRTAYGEYYTPGDTKRAEGARNFSNKSAIKNASEYTIQYREEGMITIIVEYNNGYIKVFHHELVQKKPTLEREGNTLTFSDLDGLVMVRYAMGEYTTSSEIKKAAGSKAIKPDAIVDGKISITLDPGTYTFCVQYDDESYNYYMITVD